MNLQQLNLKLIHVSAKYFSVNIMLQFKKKTYYLAGTQRRRKRETTTGNDILKNLTTAEMEKERSNFLEDKFPGMDPNGLPTKLVEFMSAPSPDIVLESHALVYDPVDEIQTCGSGKMTFQCLSKL